MTFALLLVLFTIVVLFAALYQDAIDWAWRRWAVHLSPLMRMPDFRFVLFGTRSNGDMSPDGTLIRYKFVQFLLPAYSYELVYTSDSRWCWHQYVLMWRESREACNRGWSGGFWHERPDMEGLPCK